MTVDVDKPGVKVSPTLYGIFFDEINRAGDGGLYAEMIQNRSFEDVAKNPVGWTGGTLDTTKWLNANHRGMIVPRRNETQRKGYTCTL